MKRTRPLKSPLFERLPRWPGAPNICIHANLPAFATQPELTAWQELNNPGAKAVNWQCNVCQHWHGWTWAPDPAGQSSGTTRSAKAGYPVPAHIAALRNEALAHGLVPVSDTTETNNEETNEQAEREDEGGADRA